MESEVSAAFFSWSLNIWVIGVLSIIFAIYMQGWLRVRRQVQGEHDGRRLTCFLTGLLVILLAIESPLDAFDGLLLSAHMIQHLLLMMIAPPLLLLGQPTIPMLRGLPKVFVKEGLGPFLTSRVLRVALHWLTAMPVTWALFTTSTIVWHLPKFYELALHSPAWHGFQHACFFWTGVLFWLPLIHQGPGKRRWPQWAPIPYLLFADFVNTALSAFFIFSGKILYPSYQSVRINGMTPEADQTLAGAIMWVPGSVVYLIPAICFVVRMLSEHKNEREERFTRSRVSARFSSRLLTAKRLPGLRRTAQIFMLLVAIAVMADGFLGPQLAPLNLAGVLPWIHWRALSIIALLLIGNLFCMACPFTFVRDMGRKVMPVRLRWPRVLRTKWLSVGLILLYLWAYEAFNLWSSPWATAWIIAGYFAAAFAIDGFFRGASFCKYVCPIGQFQFVSSLMSPREVRIRNQKTCQSCRTHDCIRGNEQARGCELYLFQPKKVGSLDCTFCLDCVKACPHENVSVLPVLPTNALIMDPYRSSIGRLSKRTDFAVLALVIVFGAFVNAAGMIEPVMSYEHKWHFRLGINAMPMVFAGFVLAGAVVFPAVIVTVCSLLNRLTRVKASIGELARRFAFALVPLGIAMWAAHLLYHLATGWTAAPSVIIRVITGVFANPAVPYNPGWLTPAQVLLLDAGLLVTLYVALRIAEQYAGQMRKALLLMMPWALLSLVLYGTGIWILLQPMEMRGMVH